MLCWPQMSNIAFHRILLRLPCSVSPLLDQVIMMVDDDKCAVFCVCECTKQKFWFFYRCPGNLRRVTSIQESTQKIRLISGSPV